MIRFAFYFRSALNSIIHNKLLSTAKLVTSFFCMAVVLFLIGAYSGGLSFVRERCDFRDITELKMYVAEDNRSLPKNPTEAEHFIFYAINKRILFGSKYLGGAGLALTDLRFADLFSDFFREGTYISDPEKECVIGNELAAKYKIGVAEKITIGSKEYTVCGITGNAGYRNTILLCDPRELDIGCPQMYISTKDIYGSGLVYTGTDIHNYFASMTDLSDLIPIISACVFMLIFSAVNIFNIIIIYAKKSARKTQIIRSLGASKAASFVTLFLENLLINTAAFITALALLITARSAVLSVFSTALEFGFTEIFLAFLVLVLLSLIYSFRRFKREAVCIL